MSSGENKQGRAPSQDAAALQPSVELYLPLTALRPHEHGELIPDLGPREFASFRADIQAHGILVPLEITPDGVVLDGRQRLRAAAELGIEQVPVRVVEVEDQPVYIIKAALERRQLTAS